MGTVIQLVSIRGSNKPSASLIRVEYFQPEEFSVLQELLWLGVYATGFYRTRTQ